MASEIERYSAIVDKWRKKRIEKITIEDLQEIRSLLLWAIDLGMAGQDTQYIFATRRLLSFTTVYLKTALYGFVYQIARLYKMLDRDILNWDEFVSSASKYTPYRQVFEDVYSAINVLSEMVDYSLPNELHEYMNMFISVYTATVHARNKEEFMAMFEYAVDNTEFQSLTEVEKLPVVSIPKQRHKKKNIYHLPYPYVVDLRFILYLPVMYVAYRLFDIHAFVFFIQGLLVESIPPIAINGLHLFVLRLSRVIFRAPKQWWIITSLSLISTITLGFYNTLYLYMAVGYLIFWLGEFLYYRWCECLEKSDTYMRLQMSLMLLAVVFTLFHSSDIYDALKHTVSIMFGLQ